ncbi:MAG: lamin tail domain-containing protein [Planctomycetota bacterium]
MMRRRLALCCALALLVTSSCDRSSSSATDVRLRINEVMANNRDFRFDGAPFVDVNGLHLDWVEIFNPEDSAVSLRGYTLSDNPNRPTKYRFPAIFH